MLQSIVIEEIRKSTIYATRVVQTTLHVLHISFSSSPIRGSKFPISEREFIPIPECSDERLDENRGRRFTGNALALAFADGNFREKTRSPCILAARSDCVLCCDCRTDARERRRVLSRVRPRSDWFAEKRTERGLSLFALLYISSRRAQNNNAFRAIRYRALVA